MKELKIDPELRDLLPPPTDEEYKLLEKNILENGFDKHFPIMEWKGFIADGHNRYSICKKHNIEPIVGTLAYETKEEVMKWMLDIQLGRRNLSPIQRIAVAEKYRPIYEKQAKERQAEYHGNQYDKKNIKSGLTENLPQVQKERNPTTDKYLSDIADVSEKTYRMGAKILNSDNEDLKQRVLSGKTAISAGYKELIGKKENKNIEDVTVPTTVQSTVTSPPISLSKELSKPLVENGVILLEEKTDDDKMMNDIARRMKSGQADLSKISNESELNNIKEIISTNINSAIAYVRSNLNFDEFNSSDLQRLREIIYEATNKMENLMKDMEELVNEK